MAKKKIIIIGAGIAGLTAGFHALKNGFDAEIYEKHNLPGGLCTSWKRKDYIFEGSLHWLTGSGPKSNFYKFWQELGLIETNKFLMPDEFYRIERDGRTLIIYTDIPRLQKHMLELSPEDSDLIKAFFEDIYRLSDFNMPMEKPFSEMNIFDIIKMMAQMRPYMKTMQKYSNMTLKEFAEGFKDPLIRDGLSAAIPPGYPASSILFTLAGFINNDNMITLGGALNFSKNLAEKITALGGKILYKKNVKEILVSNQKIRGIMLEDGRVCESDYVISSADPHYTQHHLLKGKFLTKELKKLFTEGTTYSSVQVSLGIDADLSNYPHWNVIKIEKPFKAGGSDDQNYISFRHYCNDPSMAPKGKSSVISLLFSDYEFWKKLGYDTPEYRAEKEKIGNIVKEEVEKHFPESKGKIEVIDVATPLTFERYTNVWKGSYMAWYSTPFKNKFMPVSDTFKGIANLYQIGMWTMNTGGVPTAMITGRWAVQRICKKEKSKFKA